MSSFSELLSEHIDRVGVSDSELARKLGVSRQTIFRWREGETQRPRHRQDVQRLASTLRLTKAEQAELMMAAGFAPEELEISNLEPQPAVAKEHQKEGGTRPALRLLIVAGAAALLLGAFLLSPAGGRWLDRMPWNRPAPAAPGELLILVSRFQNFGPETSSFNVAGRIDEAIDSAFLQAEVPARVERLNEVIASETQARQVADRWRAEFAVWGEYDSGRIIVHTTSSSENPALSDQPMHWYVGNTDELAAAINRNVPSELQSIALTVLGRVHLANGQPEQAMEVFQQALIEPPLDERSQAAIYFYLGLAASQGGQVPQSQIIAYYTEALEQRPEMVSALNNRGLEYLDRKQPGDVEKARRDFTLAADLAPELPAPAINMVALLQRHEPTNIEDLLLWLNRAEERLPTDAAIQNDLCWYYSLSQQPEAALPHCNLAVESNGLATAHESRGLALAMLGQYEQAITEFETYLSLLQSEDPALYQQIRESRMEWIDMLESGQNPFDDARRQQLLTD